MTFIETKSTTTHSHSHSHAAAHSHEIQGPSAAMYLDLLKQYLIEHFGPVHEDEEEGKYRFEVEIPDVDELVSVSVSMEDFSIEVSGVDEVVCADSKIKQSVQNVVSRITSLLDVDYII